MNFGLGNFGKMGASAGNVLSAIFDILSTKPVLNSGAWKFLDNSGNTLHCSTKNQQVCIGNGSDNVVATGINAYTNSVMVVKGKLPAVVNSRYFGHVGGNGSFGFGVSSAGKWALLYGGSAGVSGINADTTPHTFIVYANDGVAKLWVKDINQAVDDASLITLFGTAHDATYTYTMTANLEIFLFGWLATSYINFSLLSAKIGRVTANVFTWSLDVNSIHGAGNALYDSISNAWLTIAGTTTNIWDSFIDAIEPLELTEGFTAYKKDSDNTYLNVIGNNSLTISGYTKEAYYPVNSGLPKALKNKVTIPTNANINDQIPAGDYGFTEFAALSTSSNLLIDKTSLVISRVRVKKKISELIYTDLYTVFSAGQSNLDGRVEVGDLPAEYSQTITGGYIFNRSTGLWQTGQLGANTGCATNTTTNWSLDWLLYQKLIAYKEQDIYIVKRTLGGTPLAANISLYSYDRSWNSDLDAIDVVGATKMSYELETVETAALAIVQPAFTRYLPKWFLWFQGESDAKVGWKENYYTNLKAFIAYHRAVIGNPNLKFIIVTTHVDSSAYDLTIRNAQIQICNEDANCILVEYDNLTFTTIGDGLHIDSVLSESLSDIVFEIVKDY